ncbi:MAG: MBL fold metallo-hydrolase, partial [Longimicrobiales bacterium]
QLRTPTFQTGNTAPQRQIAALDGEVAFNVAANGNATRASEAVARDRRLELRHHPIGIMRAAWAPGARVTLDGQDGGRDRLRVQSGNDSFELLVDRTTHLPAAVRTRSANANLGDVTIETAFEEYGDAGGMRLPMRLITRVDRYTTANIQLTGAELDASAGDLAAPEAVRSAQPPAAPAVNVTVEDIAPGVWYLTGGSHHSVLVEFADHLMLIETPQNEARTQAVIAKAKEHRPGKPLRFAVNTHHHFDHSGGVRAAIAEGLTVVTHEGNAQFYRDVAGRAHTITPDALARNRRAPQIQTVPGRRVFQDATRTVELHALQGNAHSRSMLVAYLPTEGLLVQADLYAPPAANAPTPPPPAVFAPNLIENVRRLNLRVERVVGIHGRVVPFAEVEAAAAAAAGG